MPVWSDGEPLLDSVLCQWIIQDTDERDEIVQICLFPDGGRSDQPETLIPTTVHHPLFVSDNLMGSSTNKVALSQP